MDAYSGSAQLTPGEQCLIENLCRGETAEFRDQRTRATIRADVLRDLLLGVQGTGRTRTRIPPTGIRIRNARLDGPLDLADLARPGFGFPALILEDCDLPDPINLEGSRFARLSIKGSRFRYLNMRESEIDGPFDFSGAMPFEDPDGRPPEAWINAQGCIVNGQITGSGAHLVAPKARPAADIKESERHYSLWLANADVRGSIILLKKFVADGGVCLRSARVRGDIWASGATITAGEGFALNAQAARIGDVVALNSGFIAQGTVWLLATQIGARLLLDGAALRGTGDNRERRALQADNVHIGAAVFMGEKFTADGEVSFSGATIRGSFRCQQAMFSNQTPDGRARAFTATGAEFGDEVLFDGTEVYGRMNLNGAKIGGRLSLNGARIENKTTNGRGVALSAVGARIGGTLRFAKAGTRASMTGGRENIFECRGRVNVNGAQVGGDLVFLGSSLQNITDDGSGVAVSAKRLQVGGNLEFTGDFRAEGAVMLSGAKVGRGVCFGGAAFKNKARSAIYAKDMRIGDDLHLKKTSAEGDLRFDRIDVTGSLVWDGLTISRRCENDRHAPLDLRHARIGSVLNAKDLSFVHPSSIDLCGVQVSTIAHSWPQGWGLPRPGAPPCPVNFDGLIYNRIMLETAAKDGSAPPQRHHAHLLSRIFGPRRNSLGSKYGDWLQRQEKQIGDDESDFFPQPYRQLARVLRNQGEESAARDIAIAEQWAAPKTGLLPRVARWAFGIGFGFGLRPRNAIATLIAFLLLGTIGVGVAKHGKMLTEPMVVASTGAQYEQSDDIGPAHLKRAMPHLGGTASDSAFDVDCTDAAITWTDDLVYAADMLVPFIPLHQESKCEIKPSSDWGAGVWRSLKAIYSVTGWVIFSLALVTFSGVLKRFDRDTA